MLINYMRFVIDQFRQHKVRFLLTISGIVVGVASLAVMASFLTVGRGVLKSANMRASGEDLVTISNDWKQLDRYPNEKRLNQEDTTALDRSRTLDTVQFSPLFGMKNHTYTFDGKDDSTFTVGIDAAGLRANGLQVEEGRTFHAAEFEQLSKVVVIGAELLKKHPKPWVGKTISIRGTQLRIVGVLKKKPVMGPGGRWSWNSRILLPAGSYNLLFNPEQKPDSIAARVQPQSDVQPLKDALMAAQALINQVLMLDREVKTFRINGAEDRDDNEKTILLVIQLLMYMTTLFSMVVGGINIMNIMLVTVTERTREIGIRRALGATRRDILVQFLMESVAITLSGAFVGLLLSVFGLKLLSEVLTRVYYPWPYFVAWWAVWLGIALTVVIGIIFGLSPAIRASKMDPVEALRFE